MKVGDICTVSHHYGHTDVNRVMKIIKIEKNFSCKSKIAVWVDGLKGWVDKGLINLIGKPDKPKKMMNTVFRPTIMADKLKALGFTYKMNVWRKENFSIAFYKHLWKVSIAGSNKEYDVVYMDELYPLYWELTGKVLPRVQKDEI